MARTKKEKAEKKPVYTILNSWLQDGSKYTEIPKDIVDDKTISTTYLLYYFRSSKYICYLSSLFNNYNLYQLDRIETFTFIKDMVLRTGYKPRFLPRSFDNKSKIHKLLKRRFPFIKNNEIPFLVESIDKSEEKDSIYESLGLTVTKKEKNDSTPTGDNSTNNDSNEEEWTWDRLMHHFELDPF